MSTINKFSLSRRDFSKMLLGAVALGMVETPALYRVFGKTKRSIRWLASQTASNEGTWNELKIEGKVPQDINGNLFRVAPGKSENYGVKLKHLFDGDAYVSGWQFREGKVSLQGRFVPTPSYMKEKEAGRMLYNDFGTRAPKPKRGNSKPNVNIIEWHGKLLGLSEGHLPVVINPSTFEFEGFEDFGGVVPEYLTFTAHPRFDPKTGDMFAWGFEKRRGGKMHVLQIDNKTGKAKRLYKTKMKGFRMVHDAMLTENYFVILIPPMRYSIWSLLRGMPPGESLKFAKHEPTQLLAFPRDNKNGKAKPISIKLPPYVVFHYGNAYEESPDKITFEAITSTDDLILKILSNWKLDKFDSLELTEGEPQTLKQFSIDLSKKTYSSVDLMRDIEFPRYDMRLTGKKARYLYVADKIYDENAAIIKVDLQNRVSTDFRIGANKTIAEPVFIPKSKSANEDQGWIIAQGYDAIKNESFIQIHDAQTLDFAARIWAGGQHIPLGFHGNFYPTI